MLGQENSQGTVKWFSSEKGFGFLVGDDGEDRFFAVSSIKGKELPGNGDIVEYSATQGKKGPAAIDVRLLARAAKDAGSGRVFCLTCGKAMVPRLITYRGQPEKSVCPFCAATHKSFSSSYCFIATAVYGDGDAHEVQTLRQFRDEVLMPTGVGRAFVRGYYRVSPPIADWLRLHQTTAKVVRRGLDQIVRICERRPA